RDGDHHVDFTFGDIHFTLTAMAHAPVPTEGAIVTFEVNSIDELTEKIEMNGGKIVSLSGQERCGRTLSLADPDGNILQLLEKPAPDPLTTISADAFRAVMRTLASSVV